MRQFRYLIGTTALLGLVTVSLAQPGRWDNGNFSEARQGAAGANRAKGMWVNHESEGLQVRVIDGGTGVALRAEDLQHRPFRSGERIRLQLTSNTNGYVYLVNMAPDGGNSLLMPYGNVDNRIGANQTVMFPPDGKTIQFDGQPGQESLLVTLSASPLQAFESARHLEDRRIAYLPPQISANLGNTPYPFSSGSGLSFNTMSKGLSVVPSGSDIYITGPQSTLQQTPVSAKLTFNHL